MSIPVSQMSAVAGHVLKHVVGGTVRYPLVLMLEPLLRCNLACAGCGKIQYPGHVLAREMTVEDALAAAEQCSTPVVSVAGGEPLMHSRIAAIIEGLVHRERYVYLCTNGLPLRQKLEEGLFSPSPYLTFNVHMDGDEKAHDFAVNREGVYGKAEDAIRFAVGLGFRVTTNTTLFDRVDAVRLRSFFDRMMGLGVEAMTISPGYNYSKAPDQDHFLVRSRTCGLFRELLRRPNRAWRFNHSPLFLEFLMGKRHLECTPWGNPCYTIFGWQRPCYLLQEGYASTFQELLADTDWRSYGRASGNPKCQQCMVHCGHEPSAVHQTFTSFGGFANTVRGTLQGLDSSRGRNISPPRVTRFVKTGAESTREGTVDRALMEALDYRGDVTIELTDGTTTLGYVYDVSKRKVRLFGRSEETPVAVDRDSIFRVVHSGRDHASGTSWEAWVRADDERKRQAEQVA
ncbi:adenosyl-hopene transferase HpnH [Planctomycetota bacterium]